MSLLSRHRRTLLVILLVCLVVLFYGRDSSAHERRGGGGSGGFPEVMNSTLGFQNIFVVNLPERTDRRDAMTLCAAVTGLSLTFSAGVPGAEVAQKVLPPSERNKGENWGGKTGSWRAHMNVLQRIVQENITSALIMEDDADWDIRLKSQLPDIALASRAYLQPLRRDPSHSLSGLHSHHPAQPGGSADGVILDLHSAPATLPPHTSPYGDDWDVLWLGHVGSHLPLEPVATDPLPRAPASDLVLAFPDPTVASPRHLRRHPFAGRPDHFASAVGPHTRVVHAARRTAGIQAYAVSQRGARRLLQRFGLEEFTASYDLMLRDWCDVAGREEEVGKGEGKRPVCVATQPPVFSQWYSSGGSDIHGIGGGYFRGTGSTYVRYSVMANLKRLAAGTGGDGLEGLVDQWPDEGKGPW